MVQITLLTGPERRRRWSDDDRRRILAAAFIPGAIVADVDGDGIAHASGVTKGQSHVFYVSRRVLFVSFDYDLF